MFGDIFLCEFPFTSGAISKTRPALVLFELQQDVIICRVTSVVHNGILDIALSAWSAAGLLRPFIARLDRIITAEKKILLRKLGVLTAQDQKTIRTTWNSHMRL